MSNTLSVVPRNKISQLIADRREVFSQLLGQKVDPYPFMTSAIFEVNQMAKPCTAESVMKTVFNCGSMGLMFGQQRGHAYLVPFNNKKAGKTEAQLIVGYRGFVELAYRSRWMGAIHADVVTIDDEFSMHTDELGPHFRHVPMITRKVESLTITGAYCVWRTSDGLNGFKYIDQRTIQKAKKDDSDPWKFAYAEMAMKTAIRRAAKLWKQTGDNSDIANAIMLDEQDEREETQAAIAPLPADILDAALKLDGDDKLDNFLDVKE